MTVSDERLYQLAYDPMMCNISEDVQECLRELVELRKLGKPKAVRKMKYIDKFVEYMREELTPRPYPEEKEIVLSPKEFHDFVDTLEKPTEPSSALHHLLNNPSVIEKSSAPQEKR